MANDYGTMDGKPQIRNINRIDQRIINEFHKDDISQSKEAVASTNKQINNKIMFNVMDQYVIEKANMGILDRLINITKLTTNQGACEKAVDKVIEKGNAPEHLRSPLESGCFGTTHRHDSDKIMTTYEADREQIIEAQHPKVDVGPNKRF